MEDFRVEPTSPVILATRSGKHKLIISRASLNQDMLPAVSFKPLRLYRVGGVLKILGAYQFLDSGALRRFLLSCQSQVLILYASMFDVIVLKSCRSTNSMLLCLH